ncbi:MAG: hypothetical protein WAR79_15265 [Melioribacteraceae bacterium]
MKTNIKIIFYLTLILSSNILGSRVVGGPFRNLTIWRYWTVQNGIAKEKISFYNSDSIDVKLSAKLVYLKNDYQKDDSTIVNLWDSICVNSQSLKTLDFPLTTLADSSRIYLSITRKTKIDTTRREYPLENYFPLDEKFEDGNYISFGRINSVHLIFKIDSLILESNKEYLIELYIKSETNLQEKNNSQKIHFITHEKAQKFLKTESRYLKYLDQTPIVLETKESNVRELILGTSDFGNTIELLNDNYKKYSKIYLKIQIPEISDNKVIGAAFIIEMSEGNTSFNQLNFLVQKLL